MLGKAKSRLHVPIALGAIAACALTTVLAPGLAAAGKGGVGKGGVSGYGNVAVKGATASNFGVGTDAGTVPAKPTLAAERPSGLEAKVGNLPFTGWDLIILGGVAMVLAGTGFALHRLSTPRAPFA